jgi:hypothetical protein
LIGLKISDPLRTQQFLMALKKHVTSAHPDGNTRRSGDRLPFGRGSVLPNVNEGVDGDVDSAAALNDSGIAFCRKATPSVSNVAITPKKKQLSHEAMEDHLERRSGR